MYQHFFCHDKLILTVLSSNCLFQNKMKFKYFKYLKVSSLEKNEKYATTKYTR